MSQSTSGLQYDELGFLIGLKQTGRDVAKIDKNVEQIISLLEHALKARESQQYQNEPPQPKLSALAQALIDAQREPVNSEDLIREQRQATTAINQLLETVEDLISESAHSSNNSEAKPKRSVIQNDSVTIDSQESIARELGSDRQRDANGRFTGSGQESGSALGKITQTLSTAITNGLNSTPQGVDPTLDVATVLSPVKRVAGFMLRPLSGLMKSRKRSEPLPREQEQHNRNQLKLLQRIVDNLASKGGLLGGLGKLLGAGGGLLGGLFGKGGKGLTKLLKLGKGLPVIGALLTALSFSDWKSQNTKEKGGTVGSLAGGTIGAIAGSLLGPLGTLIGGMAGAWVGDKLGSTVAPYFKEWTDSLKAADLPGILKAGWDSFIDLATKAFKLTPAGQSASLIKDGYDWIKQKLSGNSSGTSLLFRKQYGGQGLDEPAQFGGAAIPKINPSDARSKAMDFFMSEKGGKWTKEQAAGIVSNLEAESRFNHKISGDGGKAYGIAQWHPARQKAFKQAYGKDIRNSTYEEQLAFVNHELENNEKEAGNLLRKTTTPEQAGAIVSKHYERPKEREAEAAKRANMARAVYSHEGNKVVKKEPKSNDAKQSQNKMNGTKNAHTAIVNTAENMMQSVEPRTSMLSTKKAEVTAVTRTSSLASSFTPPKINTHVEPAKEYLTSPSPQQVVVVNQNGGNINQNVSDRLLAHAITGGLGMGNNQNG